MFPVRYERGFYVPEDGILHSYRREHLKTYIALRRIRVEIRHSGKQFVKQPSCLRHMVNTAEDLGKQDTGRSCVTQCICKLLKCFCHSVGGS
jgi:hypothetical protein